MKLAGHHWDEKLLKRLWWSLIFREIMNLVHKTVNKSDKNQANNTSVEYTMVLLFELCLCLFTAASAACQGQSSFHKLLHHNNNKMKIFHSSQNDARIGKDARFMQLWLVKKTQGSADYHSLTISSLHFAVWLCFFLAMCGEYPAWDVSANRVGQSWPDESGPESMLELWDGWHSGEVGDPNEAQSAQELLPAFLGTRTSNMLQGCWERYLHL